MDEFRQWKNQRKEIAKEVVRVFVAHKLSVKEATAILELTKTAIDSYAMVELIDDTPVTSKRCTNDLSSPAQLGRETT